VARTWGQIRFELAKFRPGFDTQLITQFINASYAELLDYHNWKGLEADAVIQTVAPYTTGTVNLTNGSTAVSGVGTVFTASMTGMFFRNDSDNAYYTFTFVDATDFTLDRPYEGTSTTAGQGAAFHVFQNIYALPAGVKYIQLMTNLHLPMEMTVKTKHELHEMSPNLSIYGEPEFYAPECDTPEDAPPVLHAVEIYPIPNVFEGLPYTYQKAAVAFDGTNTSSYPMPWVSDDAIAAGAKARMLNHEQSYAGEAAQLNRFKTLRDRMMAVEVERNGPIRMKMAPRFTRHRVRRWTAHYPLGINFGPGAGSPGSP
jgi:hypothetical protein